MKSLDKTGTRYTTVLPISALYPLVPVFGIPPVLLAGAHLHYREATTEFISVLHLPSNNAHAHLNPIYLVERLLESLVVIVRILTSVVSQWPPRNARGVPCNGAPVLYYPTPVPRAI